MTLQSPCWRSLCSRGLSSPRPSEQVGLSRCPSRACAVSASVTPLHRCRGMMVCEPGDAFDTVIISSYDQKGENLVCVCVCHVAGVWLACGWLSSITKA